MICLILAAGYATRLYPLTENFPKPLLSVQGKTVLDWLLSDVDAMEGIEKSPTTSSSITSPPGKRTPLLPIPSSFSMMDQQRTPTDWEQ